jgi:putative colanic acid biosynthesis acetyltransferase WcaF
VTSPTNTFSPEAPARKPSVPARNVSPWTRRQQIVRILWAVVYRLIFRKTFHNWYGIRAWILRLFAARVGNNVRVRRTIRVEIPWNLEICDDVSIGDDVILYALAPIKLCNRAFLSQYSYLCAGTHDHTTRDYPLVCKPITVGEDCWIAADVFIGPGVTVGDRSILGARASAFSDIPPDVIAVGNPARPIRKRILREVSGETESPPPEEMNLP